MNNAEFSARNENSYSMTHDLIFQLRTVNNGRHEKTRGALKEGL
jgi:hypothetical protein